LRYLRNDLCTGASAAKPPLERQLAVQLDPELQLVERAPAGSKAPSHESRSNPRLLRFRLAVMWRGRVGATMHM
jgi:hypothetical protein